MVALGGGAGSRARGSRKGENGGSGGPGRVHGTGGFCGSAYCFCRPAAASPVGAAAKQQSIQSLCCRVDKDDRPVGR